MLCSCCSILRVFLQADVFNEPNITQFVHDTPTVTLMTPLSGRTDACGQLEDVVQWNARLKALAGSNDVAAKARRCCAPEVFHIEGTLCCAVFWLCCRQAPW